MVTSEKYDPDLIKKIIDRIVSMTPEQVETMRKFFGIQDEPRQESERVATSGDDYAS